MCHINISSEKLVDTDIFWIFDSPSNKSLYIVAPNLVLYKYGKGPLNLSNIRIGNLMKYPNLAGKTTLLRNSCTFSEAQVDDLA